jgi:hypothetical protein
MLEHCWGEGRKSAGQKGGMHDHRSEIKPAGSSKEGASSAMPSPDGPAICSGAPATASGSGSGSGGSGNGWEGRMAVAAFKLLPAHTKPWSIAKNPCQSGFEHDFCQGLEETAGIMRRNQPGLVMKWRVTNGLLIQ